ncbi:hypothetical protein ABZ023_18715 [Streptomyces sp. NPDC006367]|uniref:hypothetical protein n=1 Tax=unclassified Streptomyces TaxID=2593676 RepID=UPI0033A464E2
MRPTTTTITTETVEPVQPADCDGVAIALPQTFRVEGATLGRQPNNDGDNSGAMWFE